MRDRRRWGSARLKEKKRLAHLPWQPERARRGLSQRSDEAPSVHHHVPVSRPGLLLSYSGGCGEGRSDGAAASPPPPQRSYIHLHTYAVARTCIKEASTGYSTHSANDRVFAPRDWHRPAPSSVLRAAKRRSAIVRCAERDTPISRAPRQAGRPTRPPKRGPAPASRAAISAHSLPRRRQCLLESV